MCFHFPFPNLHHRAATCVCAMCICAAHKQAFPQHKYTQYIQHTSKHFYRFTSYNNNNNITLCLFQPKHRIFSIWFIIICDIRVKCIRISANCVTEFQSFIMKYKARFIFHSFIHTLSLFHSLSFAWRLV